MISPFNSNQREQLPGEGAGAAQLPGESSTDDGNVTPWIRRRGGRAGEGNWGERVGFGGLLRGVTSHPGVAAWDGCVIQRG